jgi:predicted ferric reductase
VPDELAAPLARGAGGRDRRLGAGGDWHPLAVAWGIVGLYLLLAVELTSLAMSRLPRRLWRRVHMASFLVFATTSVHALTAGTDRRSVPFQVAVALACGVVALLGRSGCGRPFHPSAAAPRWSTMAA